MTEAARRYRAFLKELDELIAAGRGDSPEAEEVADRMDAPWYLMTDAERDAARKNSPAPPP